LPDTQRIYQSGAFRCFRHQAGFTVSSRERSA
jgi:hypothetical protein